MPPKETALLIAVIISVPLLLFTIQKISEMRRRKLITANQALLYIIVTFIQPLLGFMLIVPLMKKGY